jgi:biotin transport system substrate-specific component
MFSIVFLALMVISANSFFYLPFTPVPITTQTFTLMLAVVVLKRKWAFFTQLGYIFMGICGLPVFAGGKGGIAVLMGPTGGYILGFAIAAYFLGNMLERKNTIKISRDIDSNIYLFISCIISLVFIYLSGYIVLLGNILLMAPGQSMALLSKMVFDLGIRPFIIADITKIILLVLITKRFSKENNV